MAKALPGRGLRLSFTPGEKNTRSLLLLLLLPLLLLLLLPLLPLPLPLLVRVVREVGPPGLRARGSLLLVPRCGGLQLGRTMS